MKREEKAIVIDQLVEKFSSNDNFYITDASGMTVAETNSLRRLCFEKGIEYKVFKNTLIQKALERMDTDYAPFDESVLKGFSGVMFSGENSNLPAKTIKEFRKKIR